MSHLCLTPSFAGCVQIEMPDTHDSCGFVLSLVQQLSRTVL